MSLLESGIIKPSINMLPMSTIEDVLNNQLTAKDTQYVGGIKSNKVAISLENDRNTVTNALKLNGLPASDYLTIENDPNLRIEKISDYFERETSILRLELYRIFELLNKQQGIHYTPESGYLETFDKTIINTTNALVVNVGNYISEIRPENSQFAIAKEWIVVEADTVVNGVTTKDLHICEIESITNNVYKLKGSITSTSKNVRLFKIKGEMLKNTFSFSQTQINAASEDFHTILLGDYDQAEEKMIGVGLGTSVQVQSNMLSMQGDNERAILDTVRVYITRSSIQSSTQLKCRIYKITGVSPSETFELIGSSLQQDIPNSGWTIFKIKKDGLPVEIKTGDKLLFAFECEGEPVYGIRVGKNDLHTNRTLYERTLGSNGKYTYKASSTHDSDILLGVTLKSVIAQSTTKYGDGLYTSPPFKVTDCNTHVKAQIKINHLPSAFVSNAGIVNASNGIILSNQLEVVGESKMVIGNAVGTFKTKDAHTYYTKEPIAATSKDKVYFVPCMLQLLAMSKPFNTQFVQKVIKLECVSASNDYIVFEAPLIEGTEYYSLQIKYEHLSNTQVAALESVIVSII